MLESVTQGCSAWLRFEPDVVALSILLLAVGTTSSREELIERVRLSEKGNYRVKVLNMQSLLPLLFNEMTTQQ